MLLRNAGVQSLNWFKATVKLFICLQDQRLGVRAGDHYRSESWNPAEMQQHTTQHTNDQAR